MRLFSYIVSRDYGFAPNPFFQVCSLATCKPRIRKAAAQGDWIVGIAPKRRNHKLVFFMKVEEKLSFNEYWHDPRFVDKKPVLTAGRMRSFGDNIYHQGRDGSWHQANSHHSLPDGSPNPRNIRTDTSANAVLLSRTFTYWGKDGPPLSQAMKLRNGETITVGIGERSNFSPEYKKLIVDELKELGFHGYAGEPLDWKKLHGK